MKKIYWIWMVCMVGMLPSSGIAQHNAVSIGQVVPDIQVQNILNRDGRDKLSDFYGEGKLLLIDFWATWCTACTRSFGKMAAIKDELGDAVEILAVTYESKEKIEEFFERYPELYKKQMLFLVGDTVLPKLFPLRMLPHVAWIGHDGKVLATTNSDEVSVESVLTAINGSVEGVLIKQDIMEFDYARNLETGDQRFIARSVLAPYLPGMLPSRGYREPYTTVLQLHDDERLLHREMHLNTPISFLYMYAAYGGRFLKHNKHMIVLEIKDSSQVVSPNMYELSNNDTLGRERWRLENSFCYELIAGQPTPANKFYKHMMEDLNKYFPVYGTMEKRWMPCYVLVARDSTVYDFRSQSEVSQFVMDTLESRKGVIDALEHFTMDQFVTFLNWLNIGIPFVNETNVSIPLDLKISMITREIQEDMDVGYLKTKLQEHGFDLYETKRLIEVLVIRDKE